jgi:hypothetical protein
MKRILFFAFAIFMTIEPAFACILTTAQKEIFKTRLCKSSEYSSFYNSGVDCLKNQFYRRAEDNGIQVALGSMCELNIQSERLKKLTVTTLKYTDALNKCLGVNFDTRTIFWKGFYSGVEKSKARGACGSTMKSRLKHRLPLLIRQGEQGQIIGKKVLQKLGVKALKD